MKIYNTTTGKTESLTIINRKSGVEWTSDLIGNADALRWNSALEMAEMSQEDFDWWANTIEGLENIDDLNEKAKELLSYEEYEKLQEELRHEGNANDYEVHISRLTAIIEDVITKNE